MNTTAPITSTAKVDLASIIASYTKHWKWFVFSVLAALVLAFIHIRYSIPEYAAAAKIQILEDKNSGSELMALQDLSLFDSGKNKVEDEIQILKSRSNFIEVVNKLGLNIRMTVQGNILDTEIYDQPKPITINYIANDSVLNSSLFSFYLDLTSDTTFGYSEKEDSPTKVYYFGKNVPTKVGDIVVTPNIKVFKGYKGSRIKISITPVGLVAQGYQARTNIAPTDKLSNIINISLTDRIQRKATDVIQTLVDTYNTNATADKKAIADKTASFIDDRISGIYTNLSNVDQSAEDFMTGRGITDLASESSLNLNVGAANNQELQTASVQLEIATAMKDVIDTQDGYETLPSNLGFQDPAITNSIAKYNELVTTRERLLQSSNELNPVVVNVDDQLANLKKSLKASFNGTTNNLNLQVNNLSKQLSRVNSKLYQAPKNERALREITRKQQTTEALYLYLLTKKEEAQIAYASAAPKSKIIDFAYGTSPIPVSPKKKIIYLAALILGLLVPFSVIYANDLLDNKIHNKVSLEAISMDVPVLAEIPKLAKKESALVSKNDRSILAESLRILRTNIDYIIKSNANGHKNNVIFVTSSVPGEGKTFLSSNLSMIFASANKKVLLIGADIRNPKLYEYLTAQNTNDSIKPTREINIGLTEYLHSNTLGFSDILNPTIINETTIDVVYSGKIPPNPTELLMNRRLKVLIDQVRPLYDYIIIDTAPLMVVTDTLLISEFADHILYVARAGMTEKKVINFPLNLMKEGKLKGLSFVVNNVDETKLGYGGKYGYGYGKSVKKWWKLF